MKKLIFSLFVFSMVSVSFAAVCHKDERKITIGEHYTDANYDASLNRIRLMAKQGRLTIVMNEDYHFQLNEHSTNDVLDLNGSIRAKFKKMNAKNINVGGYTLKAGTRLPIKGYSIADYKLTYFKEIADLYSVQSDLPVSGFYIYMDRLALAQAPFIVCGF